MKKLLIIEDHDIVILGLKHIIQTSFPDTFETDSAKTGREALRKIVEFKYDLYIIDLELPDMTGFEIIENIRKRYADSKIIIHTQHDELWYQKKLISYQVNGICLKSADSAEIIHAIHQIMQGKNFFFSETDTEPKINSDVIKTPGKNLSEREMSVLKCISKGLNTIEIAQELCISVNTVETHRKHLNEKLEAKNTASLIMNAVKFGLLTALEN